LRDATGADPADVVRSHLLTREVFELPELWRGIDALDNVVTDDVQARMLIDIGRLSALGSAWFLRSKRLHDELKATVARFAPGIRAIASQVPGLLQGGAREEVVREVGELQEAGVPAELARRVAGIEALAGALDVVEIAAVTGQAVEAVATVYYELGSRLGLDWLAQRVGVIAAEGHWQTLAKGALRDDLAELQRALTQDVFALPAGSAAPAERIGAWEAANRTTRERATRIVEEIRSVPISDLAMLSVALRELRNLAGGSGAAQAVSATGPG
jgi:glutamate dehydrogenase